VDYKRIYEAFIKDRRAKEIELSGYSERHHILPRCLGGGDELGNVIALTADDHFFAHLLLARIHGGKLASALHLMMQITENHWGRRHHSRRAYGLAKVIVAKGLSEHWAGDRNPLFNHQRYDWENYRTGERRKATLFDMWITLGASRPSWTSVANGDRPSIRGWRLARNTAHKRSEKGQSFRFVNRDGRQFVGTQSAFAQAHGVNFASASRVVRHRSVTACGWRLSGVKDRPANWAKDGLPSRKRRAPSAT
jgi:hypothetical protein